MKLKHALALSLCVLFCGCASNVLPMGKNTYMVQHGGWPHMDQLEMEARCLKDANKYCSKRGLEIVDVKFEGQPGQVFQHNATSKLTFKAVPKGSAKDVPLVPAKTPDTAIDAQKKP